MWKVLGLVFTIVSGNAAAAIVELSEIPVNWKLENYMGNNVVLWGTSSTCSGGVVVFPSGATTEDKNRLWSLIMAAKVSSSRIFVRYNNASGCVLESFGILN